MKPLTLDQFLELLQSLKSKGYPGNRNITFCSDSLDRLVTGFIFDDDGNIKLESMIKPIEEGEE